MSLGSETRAAVAAFLRDVMRRDPIPGLSIALVTDDDLAYADGFGSRDRAGNRPATADTLYGIGSVTKSFAGIAVLQLADAGMLDLDDPVSEHLSVDLGDEDPPIRIHHLLTHSSGFPSLGVSEELIARRLRRGGTGVPLGDRADFHAHLEGATAERAAPPGERFAYCNSGYGLVGEIIEATTGKPFDSYVEEHLFDPLGMDRATFDDREFARDDDHMTQYLIEEGEPTAASLPTRDIGRAAGGILASVRDLGAYLRLQLNEGSYDGTRLVSTEAMREAHAGHVDTPSGPYGYGWRARETCGRTLIGHSGSIAVSSAYAGFNHDEGVGIAIAANSSPEYSLGVLGQGVFAILVGEEPGESVPFFQRRRRFDQITGTYASYRGITRAAVRRDGEFLRLEYDGPLGGEATPLVPDPDAAADTTDFYALDASGYRRPAEFRIDQDGVDLLVDRWRLHKVGDEPAQFD